MLTGRTQKGRRGDPAKRAKSTTQQILKANSLIKTSIRLKICCCLKSAHATLKNLCSATWKWRTHWNPVLLSRVGQALSVKVTKLGKLRIVRKDDRTTTSENSVPRKVVKTTSKRSASLSLLKISRRLLTVATTTMTMNTVRCSLNWAKTTTRIWTHQQNLLAPTSTSINSRSGRRVAIKFSSEK